MHRICKNCGSSNSEHARFCTKCGGALHSHEHAHERTPAEQAADVSEKAKVEANKVIEKTKHIWSGFSKAEKIIAIGAIAGLAAFVLPWVSAGGQSVSGFSAASNSGYVYLLPLLMVASLLLLYFTQGASDTRKVLMTRWQIIIGSVTSTVGLFMIIFISTIGSLMSQMMGGIGALFGGGSFGVSAGIGVYLYAAGAIAVVVGAFRLQGEVLQRLRDKD
ncbi:MAG TPA: zinc ribbon domain-containing protein [Candidatus Paceibacterota bacterium]